MHYEKILIAIRALVRVKGEIHPCRPDRQKILQTESDAGTKVFEKIIEGIGNDIGTAFIWLKAAFGPGAVGRNIAVVKKHRIDQIADQALAQFQVENIESISAN